MPLSAKSLRFIVFVKLIRCGLFWNLFLIMLFTKHLLSGRCFFIFFGKGCGMEMVNTPEPDSDPFSFISKEKVNHTRSPFLHHEQRSSIDSDQKKEYKMVKLAKKTR